MVCLFLGLFLFVFFGFWACLGCFGGFSDPFRKPKAFGEGVQRLGNSRALNPRIRGAL